MTRSPAPRRPLLPALEAASRLRAAALTFRALGAFAIADACDTLVERELASVATDERDEPTPRST